MMLSVRLIGERLACTQEYPEMNDDNMECIAQRQAWHGRKFVYVV